MIKEIAGEHMFIPGRLKNRLWKPDRTNWKERAKEKPSNVKILNVDGTIKEIIQLHNRTACPALPEVKENTDILNERDNERYVEWREAILRRDHRKCCLCQSKEWPVVHHIIRWVDDKSKRYDLQNGVTLCTFHHSKYHGLYMQPFPKGITYILTKYVKSLYG